MKIISLPTAFLIMFVAFKLSGIIDWSWFWVLSPVWIPVLFIVAIVVVVFTAAIVANRSTLFGRGK